MKRQRGLMGVFAVFGLCLAVLVGCPPREVDVTFSVDMFNETVSADGIHLAGDFQGWFPDSTEMTDADGDGVFEVTVTMEPATIQFKFINGADWAGAELVPAECGVDDGTGVYNREFTVPAGGGAVDFIFGTCSAIGAEVDVEFMVDMYDVVVSELGVLLLGNFEGWTRDAVEMTDLDGDDVYEATVSTREGRYLYYKASNGDAFEPVPAACGVDDGLGGYNREYYVPEGGGAIGYFFGECAFVGDRVDVTFQVDMSDEVVSEAGVHLVGSFQGWDTTATEMIDGDGDDIYEATIRSREGRLLSYKFINGDTWPDAEIVPETCGVDDGTGVFNREYIVPIDGGTIGYVFGACDVLIPEVVVVFLVDMNNEDVSEMGVHLSGSFQGWDTTATEMTDGEGIYEVAVVLQQESVVQFKFVNGDTWADAETVPEACGVDNGFGGFNREFTIPVGGGAFGVVFGTCDEID